MPDASSPDNSIHQQDSPWPAQICGRPARPTSVVGFVSSAVLFTWEAMAESERVDGQRIESIG